MKTPQQIRNEVEKDPLDEIFVMPKKRADPIIHRFEAEYLSWLESIKIRRLAYDSAKLYLKQAKVNAERSKKKWKSYPYRIRKWAKNNFGKVMDNMEKEIKQ